MKNTSTVKTISKISVFAALVALALPLEAGRGVKGTCPDGNPLGSRHMQSNHVQNGTGSGSRHAYGEPSGSGTGTHSQKKDGSGLGQGGTQGKRQGTGNGAGGNCSSVSNPSIDGGEL